MSRETLSLKAYGHMTTSHMDAGCGQQLGPEDGVAVHGSRSHGLTGTKPGHDEALFADND